MTKSMETIKFRRKDKTNYKKRLKTLMAKLPRIVVRKTMKRIYVQGIEYMPEGDRVIFTVSSKNLEKLGWKAGTKNMPTSYLTGLLGGVRAKKAGIKEAVFDIGLNPAVKGSRIFAVLQGLLDAGIKIPHGEEILVDKDRLKGAHIAKYSKAADLKKDQFSAYKKDGINTQDYPKMIEDMKKKIAEL